MTNRETSELLAVALASPKADDALELVDQATRSAQSTYDALRAEEGRTAEWIAEQIAKAYEAARADLRSRLERLVEPLERDHRDDAARVIGLDGLKGDVASLSIASRDAADRVKAAGSKDERLRMLDRATLTGDEPMARAVAEWALVNGAVDVFNEFLEHRPHLDAAGTRLWDSHRRRGRGDDTMGAAMRLYGLRPAEGVAQPLSASVRWG